MYTLWVTAALDDKVQSLARRYTFQREEMKKKMQTFDQYVEALVKVGMDQAEAERRVADQRKRGLLSEPPVPKQKEEEIP